jgi:hypothetical protein
MNTVFMEWNRFLTQAQIKDTKKIQEKKGRLIDMRVEGHHSNLIMSLELWKIGILLVRLAQALWK